MNTHANAVLRFYMQSTPTTTCTPINTNTVMPGTYFINPTTGTATITAPTGTGPLYLYGLDDSDPQWSGHVDPNLIVIHGGTERTIKLPDGTVIDVAKDGSFTINDKDAKVTYRANRVRDFNSFINASDKLEDFIKFCGAAGVKASEMLDIPVKHFIAWLIVEAARADGEDAPVTALPALPAPKKPHRCPSCGRFAPIKLSHCRPKCLEVELRKNVCDQKNVHHSQPHSRAGQLPAIPRLVGP